jgi:ArsR family transcriptional regulator
MDIDMIEISKALSNETRLNILLWLKDPEGNFP